MQENKLLKLQGSASARAPKVGIPEPLDRTRKPDQGKLLSLKGSAQASTAKVGSLEPTAPTK
ncbi:hypothetical protein [Shimia haliotis]|uniref:Uncharacterized protein n=1 Tax=Shimia haliotis TaxID=1280847 RepID=A0A1I4C3A3_9RHOB|nr:hypothetical protein [Shimia haliotis]SFK75090.1 hypothetical protein SAMN04488036_10210 [Shimia haliotis]